MDSIHSMPPQEFTLERKHAYAYPVKREDLAGQVCETVGSIRCYHSSPESVELQVRAPKPATVAIAGSSLGPIQVRQLRDYLTAALRKWGLE